jgi:hypothetical protein
MAVQVYGSARTQSKAVFLLVELLPCEIKQRCGEKGEHDYAEQIAGG